MCCAPVTAPSTVGFGLHHRRRERCIFLSYVLKISHQNVFKKAAWFAGTPQLMEHFKKSALIMNIQFHSTSIQGSVMQRSVAEAAQYALLRRLAPVIRHNMAGTLQPIAMVAAMLERRLQKADADPETLLRNARDIVALSKEAAASCVDLMGWLAPKDNRSVGAIKGISECLDMVTTQLSFKGFSIVDDTSPINVEIPQSALRHVLTAAIITLTDTAAGPGVLRIKTELAEGFFSIHASLGEPNANTSAPGPENLSYRQLEWQDLEALAQRESVGFTRAENQIVLHFETTLTASDKLAEEAQA